MWVDLHTPSEQEEIIVDMAFSIDLPTHREMQDIELSRRLYRADNAMFMTVTIITNADTKKPESTVVTFIYADDRLLTLRYADPLPFDRFKTEREQELSSYDTAHRIFEGLVSAIVERLAEVLENTGLALDNLSTEIFRPTPTLAERKAARKKGIPARDMEEILRRLGRCSDLLSRARESLASVSRMLKFFINHQKQLPPDVAEQLRTLNQDLQPLTDHSSFLSSKVNFLLDATLGVINIEQNAIIKIFTVASVLFLPPTVVGTIYGMNFEAMPELKWAAGYPFAIVLMVFSAIVPFLYFKRRGWF